MKGSNAKDHSAVLFFEVCARIEECCAELYHYYSEIHRDSEYISSMWKKTALEEEGHQKQFVLATKILKDVDYELSGDLERARRMYQKLNSLLDHVRKNPPEPEVALNKAIEMEESLGDLHLDSAVIFKDDSINQMFRALRNFDQEHVTAMQRCLTILQLSESNKCS